MDLLELWNIVKRLYLREYDEEIEDPCKDCSAYPDSCEYCKYNGDS